MNDERTKGFIDGVMVSAQFLAFDHDEGTLAEHLLIHSGISKKELLASQKSSDYQNELMIDVINEAFRREELRNTRKGLIGVKK